MPWKAVGPLDLTLLTARGRRLTKRIYPGGIDDYDDAALFRVDALRFAGVDSFPELLLTLAPAVSTCALRAAVTVPLHPDLEIRCRIHDRDGQPALFREVPRAWVMIDAEPDTCPPWIDPTDPVEVGGWLRRQLPPAFQMARCCVQLSSGAGIKPGLRGHLWFVLDRPLVRAELKRLLGDVEGLDTSTFSARQFHYTASPIFAGVDDPCIWGRITVLPGLAEVSVPDLAPERARHAFIPIGHGLGRGGGAERYAEACLRRLALAPEGRRHPTCIAVACRLLSLAKGGRHPRRVAGQIKGVMIGKGFDGRNGRDLSEVDRILEWAWQQVEPEEVQQQKTNEQENVLLRLSEAWWGSAIAPFRHAGPAFRAAVLQHQHVVGRDVEIAALHFARHVVVVVEGDGLAAVAQQARLGRRRLHHAAARRQIAGEHGGRFGAETGSLKAWITSALYTSAPAMFSPIVLPVTVRQERSSVCASCAISARRPPA